MAYTKYSNRAAFRKPERGRGMLEVISHVEEGAMRRLVSFAVSLLLTAFVHGQTVSPEQRAAKAFDAARASPLELHAFLERMPKGADLHMHLSGAVYAETFIANAATDGLCVNLKALTLTKSVGETKSTPPEAICAEGDVPAANALVNQRLYDALVDSFSMRGFVPTPGTTGHDQFFATFDRFGGLKEHAGEWLDEVATRAAAQNEQYLEIMQTPSFGAASALGYKLGWPAALAGPLDRRGNGPTAETTAAFARLREQLLADPAFRANVEADRKELAGDLATRMRIERCGEAGAAAACSVQIRFLGQVLRAFPPQQVFAQTLLYMELASSDADVVGINFVQPEDAYMAMSEYHRQMLMLDCLHSVYPKVHISLHAGELAPGMVPPEGLRFHIREAIDLGHAERVGHGVDVMQEEDPHALLREMADRHVMAEVNLTSNDVILGISANRHSLPAYRAAHVPVALSTDDEGVSRIDLTHEYTRAALEFNLSYLDLKQMARTSLEHSFLAGPSLWANMDSFGRVVNACAKQALGSETPGAACLSFLRASDKAGQQWELERRYAMFEDGFSGPSER